MAQSTDFFVSYTGTDTAWAEWIAQTLEEAGYRTVVQAWDFRPGQDFVHHNSWDHAYSGSQGQDIWMLGFTTG
jgi:TIR domain